MSITAGNALLVVGAETRDTFFCLGPKHGFTKWVFPLIAWQEAATLLGCNRPMQTDIAGEYKGVHTFLRFLFLSPVRHPASLGPCGDLFHTAVHYRISLEP